jgi:probable rRNA maturation factor
VTPRINIHNRNKKFKLNELFLKHLAFEVLDIVKGRGIGELEIVFLSDKAIKPLNKKYMGQNRPTDVLSFNIDAGEFRKKGFFGELFISTDTALANSKFYGARLENEIALYVIHGILHLFGYEDYTKKDRLEMSKKQDKVLETLCKRIDLYKVLTRQ